MLKLEFDAKYIGENRSILIKDQTYTLVFESVGNNPQVRVTTMDTVFNYPSKKKFLTVWQPEEGWEKKKASLILKMPDRSKKQKASNITIADAGAVIYTELMAAVNRFNEMSKVTYKDEPEKIALFTIRLEQQVYNDETRAQTKLYGAGVLVMEIEQGGQKRKIFNEGISFATAKDLDNVNAYAPKLYLELLNTFVESALLYCLSLNPDNPDVAKELENAEKERKSTDL